MIAGLIIAAIGAAWYYAPWLFEWFGRLPGDIKIENDQVKIYIPIVSMLLLSLALTLLVYLLRR